MTTDNAPVIYPTRRAPVGEEAARPPYQRQSDGAPPVGSPPYFSSQVRAVAVKSYPPTARDCKSVIIGAGQVMIAQERPNRHGCLIRNEDASNSIRVGNKDQITATNGTLLKANEWVILEGQPEVWGILTTLGGAAVAVSVADEYLEMPA